MTVQLNCLHTPHSPSLAKITRRLFVMPGNVCLPRMRSISTSLNKPSLKEPSLKQPRPWYMREEASQLFELAIVVPVLMLILAGTVDFGRAYFVDMEVSAAAEAGAMYGSQNPTDTAGMQSAASLNSPDLPNLTSIATNGTECADGTAPSGTPATCASTVVQYVEVDTTATYSPILAYPGIQSLFTLTGKSRMRASY